jgi:hypothetical protein
MGLHLINVFGGLEEVLRLPIIAGLQLSWLLNDNAPLEVSNPVSLVPYDSGEEDGFAIVLECQHSPVIML